MSNALEVVKQQAPQTHDLPQVYYGFGDIEKMADAVAKSGLFGMKTKEQAMALMLTAQAEGQHPATITQDYDIIQGRPARKTNSVLARFQAAGGRVQWKEFTPTCVIGVFSHPQGGSVQVEWTIEMAKNAGLAGKDNWKGYPRAMLRARCIAEGVRAIYPAAIGGMLIKEEAEDLGTVIDNTTGEIVQQPKSKSEKEAPKAEPEQAQTHTEAGVAGSLREGAAERAQRAQGEIDPPSGPATAGALTPGMLKTVRARIAAANENVGLTEEKVCEKFKVAKLEDIQASSVNDVLGFIANPG